VVGADHGRIQAPPLGGGGRARAVACDAPSRCQRAAGREPMASVDQQAAEQATDGQATEVAAEIQVENPATGEVIATVPDMTAEQVAELARKGRAVQPAWESLGFEGRGRILLRAQKWLVDNADRVIETIVSETGKAWEDAQLAEISYCASAFGFWAKNAPQYLADEKVK